MLQWFDRFVRRIFLQNLHLKVIAALLTLALYLWVSVDREVERTRQAPVRVEVPDGMVLTNDPPDRVNISVRGRWSDLTRLDSSELDPIRVSVDPAMGRRGRISLSPDMVDLPPGLRAVGIEPSYVPFRVEERHHKTVRVRPNLIGEPPDGYEVGDVNVNPSTIEISGPSHSLEELASVTTDPIDVTGRSQSFSREVRPRIEDPLVEYDLEEPLAVEVELEALEVTRTIADLTVAPVGIDAALATSIEPQRVDIRVRGPKTVLDNLDKDEILASLDLSDQQVERPRVIEQEVAIHNLPRNVELIEAQPRVFRVRLHPEESNEPVD